mmetsp:Transcript_20585/g.61363  ORF Transcript_20585/g.61363 Transcript_20585/m.61363 type:complete len:212 (+) Transcript_20585:1775-2410(+)
MWGRFSVQLRDVRMQPRCMSLWRNALAHGKRSVNLDGWIGEIVCDGRIQQIHMHMRMHMCLCSLCTCAEWQRRCSRSRPPVAPAAASVRGPHSAMALASPLGTLSSVRQWCEAQSHTASEPSMCAVTTLFPAASIVVTRFTSLQGALSAGALLLLTQSSWTSCKCSRPTSRWSHGSQMLTPPSWQANNTQFWCTRLRPVPSSACTSGSAKQ